MAATVERTLEYLGEKPSRVAPAPKAARKSARKMARVRAGTMGKARKKAGKDLGGTGGRTASAEQVRISLYAPQVSSDAVGVLARNLHVSPEVVLKVSKIAPRTYHRRQADQERLTETESDRLLRIARVAMEAEKVFGSQEKSTRWLSTPSSILGAVPLELLATDAGAREVEHELVRIEHGDFA